MKKLLIAFDDETANLLSKEINMSEVVRKATQLYIEHISTDTIDGIRTSYKIIAKKLQDIDSKIDYLARKLWVAINR